MDVPPKTNKPSPPLAVPPNWRWMIWYVVLTLSFLWLWQEAFRQLTIRTVAYSEFKTALHHGEVSECVVKQDEIAGRIMPAAAVPANQAKPAVAAPKPATAPAKSPAAAPPPSGRAPASGATTAAPAAAQPAAAQPPNPPAAAAAKPEPFLFRTVRVDDPKLVTELEQAHVRFTGERPSFISQILWAWLLPIAGLILVWSFIARRLRGVGESVLSFGSSRARLVAEKDIRVTFNDVAGADEAKDELQEVVEFLKFPERFRALGAKIPKGVLLVGPPGCGKTLLARAVAGEAKVPFYFISGSEFVEMFVGVGAARVRDLFEKAKNTAPCIVFIDELDAVGRQRSVPLVGANDEREQTLNQLLVGMDGFDPNIGVVVLAATNRPEVLDHALLRPGRFDRQVVVDAPDVAGREAVLKIHARGKPLAPDVDLKRIAQQTPGLSGADLANVLNEAALLTARHHGRQIGQPDLQEAVEKVVAGPERRSRRLGTPERQRVAYHETGHALVSAYTAHPDVLHKISIIPRGHAALGYTLQLPEVDRYLMSESELLDKLKTMLGGRAAEQIIYDEVSTGAENDLEHATGLARQMVCLYGMSAKVGLAHTGQRPDLFRRAFTDGQLQRDCSEATAREIDEEVKRLLDSAYGSAQQILAAHRDQLERIAAELMTAETIDADRFKQLLAAPSQAAAA